MARFYTVQETATILGFSTNSIYKFLDQGRLKSTRGNSKQGRFRIPHTSVEDFLGTKLPETAVSRALAAATQPKTADTPRHLINPDIPLPQKPTPIKKVTSPSPESISSSTNHTRRTPALGVALTRLLILVALLLTIIEAVTTPVVTLTGQFFRLLILTITILLAYQSGGSLERPHS